MKFNILCYTRLHNCATLAGLARDVTGFSGDLQFSIQEPALVFWDKMSFWAIQCICELCADRILLIDVSFDDSYYYLADGGEPIIRSFRDANIRWNPLVFKLSRKIHFSPEQCKQIKWLIFHERLNSEKYWHYPLPELEIERIYLEKIMNMSRNWSQTTARRSFSRYIEQIDLQNLLV